MAKIHHSLPQMCFPYSTLKIKIKIKLLKNGSFFRSLSANLITIKVTIDVDFFFHFKIDIINICVWVNVRLLCRKFLLAYIAFTNILCNTGHVFTKLFFLFFLFFHFFFFFFLFISLIVDVVKKHMKALNDEIFLFAKNTFHEKSKSLITKESDKHEIFHQWP